MKAFGVLLLVSVLPLGCHNKSEPPPPIATVSAAPRRERGSSGVCGGLCRGGGLCCGSRLRRGAAPGRRREGSPDAGGLRGAGNDRHHGGQCSPSADGDRQRGRQVERAPVGYLRVRRRWLAGSDPV